MATRQESIVHARACRLNRAADRAVDDPVKLASATRIVRAALERQRLTPADLGLTVGTTQRGTS